MKYLYGLAVLLLTGCASPPVIQTVTVTKFLKPDIPPALLSCMGEPAIPPMTMQSQAAALLVHVDIAGEDCRLHLAAVKQALGQ
ncbi:MAG TPA: hypothetical protein PLI96_07915 [Halothiobacillus sp.]|nr:hypothetical protein [Halothiobacillus sp.]